MIHYSIIPEQDLMFCHFSGKLNLFDLNKYVQQLMRDENYKPELKTIITVSQGTIFSYNKDAKELQRFFSYYIQQRKGAAWAIVAPDKTTQVMTSIIMDSVDVPHVNVGYFDSEEDAKRWLLN